MSSAPRRSKRLSNELNQKSKRQKNAPRNEEEQKIVRDPEWQTNFMEELVWILQENTKKLEYLFHTKDATNDWLIFPTTNRILKNTDPTPITSSARYITSALEKVGVSPSRDIENQITESKPKNKRISIPAYVKKKFDLGNDQVHPTLWKQKYLLINFNPHTNGTLDWTKGIRAPDDDEFSPWPPKWFVQALDDAAIKTLTNKVRLSNLGASVDLDIHKKLSEDSNNTAPTISSESSQSEHHHSPSIHPSSVNPSDNPSDNPDSSTDHPSNSICDAMNSSSEAKAKSLKEHLVSIQSHDLDDENLNFGSIDEDEQDVQQILSPLTINESTPSCTAHTTLARVGRTSPQLEKKQVHEHDQPHCTPATSKYIETKFPKAAKDILTLKKGERLTWDDEKMDEGWKSRNSINQCTNRAEQVLFAGTKGNICRYAQVINKLISKMPDNCKNLLSIGSGDETAILCSQRQLIEDLKAKSRLKPNQELIDAVAFASLYHVDIDDKKLLKSIAKHLGISEHVLNKNVEKIKSAKEAEALSDKVIYHHDLRRTRRDAHSQNEVKECVEAFCHSDFNITRVDSNDTKPIKIRRASHDEYHAKRIPVMFSITLVNQKLRIKITTINSIMHA